MLGLAKEIDETVLSNFLSVAGTSSVSACNPEVFNFYTYLRTHPLLLRRHFGSSNKAKVGLTAEVRSADSISLDERRLFFTAAYAHLHAGCPMLALEVLSKMPKVRKHSRPQDDTGNTAEVSVGSRNGQASDPDWCQSALNGYESDGNSLSNSRSDSVLSFDWSQPSVVVPDEPLELKWDSDKDDEENEDEEETKNGKSGSGSVFHEPVSLVEESEDSNDYIEPSDDILVTQLKFAACLKIMTNELRTLSTGYELDGGKLRYQLCLWLEREVLTYTYLNSFANFEVKFHFSFFFKMYLFIHLCYITSLSADLKPRNKTFVFYIMPTHLLLAFMIIEHLVCVHINVTFHG